MDTSSFFFISREMTDYSELFKRVRMMPLYSFPHFKDFNHKIICNTNRFFIHLDFDAFYAQVEQRDNPKLKCKPVSVGGTPDGKGIVMTASYEARALGIDTGMSVWEAKQICPALISLPCYGPKYEGIMNTIMEELKSFTCEEFIEQYSIDECFLDISSIVRNFKEAESIATAIKKRIKKVENLTTSLGVSYNKTYAKIATKFKKPDGLTIITKEDKPEIYLLPVSKLWGVGRRIEKRLSVMNIHTIGSLANTSPGALKKEFGINGIVFRKLARGEDTSGIYKKNSHEKGLSHQHSLAKNIYNNNDIEAELRRVSEYMCRKLRSKKLVAGHLWLTARYEDLRYAGDDIRLKQYTNDDREIFDSAITLFKKFPQPTKNFQLRMFGMTVFDLHKDNKQSNYELFEKKVHLPFYAIDKLKYKFGENIIRVGIKT